MNNKRDSLNLVPSILFIVMIIIIGAGGVYIFDQINQRRGEKIVEQYTDEVNQYVSANQQGIEELFNTVFPDEVCPDKENAYSCHMVEQNQIMDLISDDLQDFSSTAFIKDSTISGVMVMRLSGDVSRISPPVPGMGSHPDLEKLLDGEVDQIEWQPYTNAFSWQTKEVVVPIKNSQGEVIGAITRGVIEK